MDVSAFFTEGVELVEKQDARSGANVVEEPPEAGVGLAEVATHKHIVANEEQGQSQVLGNRFGERGLAVAGRAREQQPMPRFQPVRPENIGAPVLLAELPSSFSDRQGKPEIVETDLRRNL